MDIRALGNVQQNSLRRSQSFDLKESEHDLNILWFRNVHQMLQHVKFKWLKGNTTN